MIMKFSTHSCHYIYLLREPFLLAKITMRINNYELKMQYKEVTVAMKSSADFRYKAACLYFIIFHIDMCERVA